MSPQTDRQTLAIMNNTRVLKRALRKGSRSWMDKDTDSDDSGDERGGTSKRRRKLGLDEMTPQRGVRMVLSDVEDRILDKAGSFTLTEDEGMGPGHVAKLVYLKLSDTATGAPMWEHGGPNFKFNRVSSCEPQYHKACPPSAPLLWSPKVAYENAEGISRLALQRVGKFDGVITSEKRKRDQFKAGSGDSTPMWSGSD